MIYVRKAGTTILCISVLLWAMASYPKLDRQMYPNLSEAQYASESLRHSWAGRLGVAMEPVLSPLGFDWKLSTAMLGAFAAKEVFVAQLSIVYAMEVEDQKGLEEALRRDYSPLVGISMILFLLIGTPCMATVAITRRETGQWRWALFQLVGLTGIAYAVSCIVYQVG